MRLSTLQPEWLSKGEGRSAMGVRFHCSEHQNCHVDVWFDAPIDEGPAVTGTAGRPLHHAWGHDFETLSWWPPVPHGQAGVIHCFEGEVDFP